MSDIRRVEIDTKHDRSSVMRALSDTEGMSTPQKAEFWLHGLAWTKHRGRHDTWSAARDRAAKDAGIERTIAKRIWQRWEDMKDVGGSALLGLMLAYEDACQRNDDAIEAYRAERLKLKAERHAVDHKRARESVGENDARN
jgi:hypothetical protein